jgi:O-antigen ligase
MDPYGGIRLLAILVVTSTPFLFLGAALSTAPLSVIVAPLIFSALVSAIGAVVLDVIGPIALGGYLFENFHFSEHPLRWAFLYQEANGLGWALALGIGACLAAAAASTRTPLRAVIVLGVFPFLVWVLLKTNSRASAAWVLFYLMGYALYAMHTVTQRRKIRWSWLAIITAAVVSFFSFSIAWNWSHISAYLRLDETDLTTGRLKIWLLYLNIFAEHPLLGAGFGTTSLLTLGETPKSPLNVLFGMLGETGLVGTALFLALWAGAIRRLWQKLRMQARDSDLRNQVNLFAVLSLVGLVIHQQGEWNLLRIAPINFLFFFLVGVAWSKSATQIDKQG